MLTLSQLYAQGSNFQVLDQINAAYNCCFTTCISTHVYTHTLVGHHLLPSNNPFVLARGVWDTRREKRKAIVNLFPLHIIPPWPRSRPLRFDGTFIEIHFFFFCFFTLSYPLYTIVCPLSLSSPLSTGEPCPLASVNWRAPSFPFRPVFLPPPLPSSPSPSPSLPSIGRYRELPLLVSSLLSFRLPPSSFPSLLLGSSHRLVPCGFCLRQVIDWGLEEERYSFLSWCLVFFVFCL